MFNYLNYNGFAGGSLRIVREAEIQQITKFEGAGHGKACSDIGVG